MSTPLTSVSPIHWFDPNTNQEEWGLGYEEHLSLRPTSGLGLVHRSLSPVVIPPTFTPTRAALSPQKGRTG